MAMYIKKPIPVRAIQWIGPNTSFPKCYMPGVMFEPLTGRYYLSTIENQRLYLTEGCWIVGPGSKGEYWPVDNEVFTATYEKIGEVTHAVS